MLAKKNHTDIHLHRNLQHRTITNSRQDAAEGSRLCLPAAIWWTDSGPFVPLCETWRCAQNL